ncbi:MAG TPA: hypothetical protein VHR47_03215 [Bacillota bacterium]|nr:hypothetical protein [Bacillota bacterium]
MKKLMLLLISGLLTVATISPGAFAGEALKFIEDKKAPDLYEMVDAAVQGYEENLVRAINENRFSRVERYLVSGSNLYEAQKTLVKQLYAKGIKERFIASDMLNCESDTEVPDRYSVYVSVTVGIINHGKPETRKVFQWIYTVQKTKSGFKLSDIEKWKDYQTFIDMKNSSVKADGFYTDELMQNYGALLLNAINTLNITQLKEVSANNRVLEEQKKIITGLRKKGSTFELNHYEYTPTDDLCNYCKVVMVFKPTQASNKSSAVTIKYRFNLEEVRKNWYGYAVIKEIMPIK